MGFFKSLESGPKTISKNSRKKIMPIAFDDSADNSCRRLP